MTGFIYVLKCPESGAVRYVGKATDIKARYRQHMYDARSGNKSHKCCWIRSLLSFGLRPVIEVDIVLSDGENWKQIEVERVAHYRSNGCSLTNGTAGGDEPGELTEAGRSALADAARARFGSPDGRARQAQIMRELCTSREWLASRTAAAKTTRASAEFKAAASARSRALWANPEYRERMLKARAEVVARQDYRQKLSKATARHMSDPANRRLVAERTRASWLEGRR